MSRRWERMIEKNQKTLSKQKGKQGTGASFKTGQQVVYKGRHWVFPSVLVALAFFYFFVFSGVAETDWTYKVTPILYLILAILIFLIRRPTLTIGKSHLSSARFTGEKRMEASDVEAIHFMKSYVIIQSNKKRNRWVFSRLLHRMPIPEMTDKLKEFANQNGIRTE
ncbi:hypothetical protein J31TS4_05950 [Paenibacillus sp. J31TS4]|uniref:hypothetical protein n=1 Tax=Paenibacillus sp. J31TS4 TaxID=2807195 RepID=UPI001B107579|nr:hypothetical protein [Paenibacillus sp. J31TS4]GIP37315.1 hypothetical protein J31TS4_05950 [Paenibacillus sp. J31TS4]